MPHRLLAGLLLATLAPGAEPALQPIPVRSWSVVGPWPSESTADLDRPFPPESGRDFTRELPGPGPGSWLSWSEAAAGGGLRLPHLMDCQGAAVSYAVTYIEAPAACQVQLAIAPAAGQRAWIDCERVAAESTIALSAGLHELMVKQRLGGSADTLQVTCAGPAGLRFLPQPPWPLRPLPVAMWRCARPADAAVLAALRERLAQPGGLGLPAPSGVVWEAPPAEGASLHCAGARTLVLAGHIYFPLKYHLQEYHVRLRGLRPAAVLLDGRSMALAAEPDGAVGFRVASHRLQQGFNRLSVELQPGADGFLAVEISDPGDLKFAAEVPPALDPAASAQAWPSATISNGLVSARLALPDDERGLYRGNRFERAGIIARLEYRGHTFFVGAPADPRPLDHGVCYGPAEEWFEALAWHDAPQGGAFLKMGVGLFERAAHPRHMWYCTYWPQAVLPWTSRIEASTAEFTQVCAGPRGWAYRYVKRLVLAPGRPELRIEHELANTGSQAISGEQYNHNFIRLDGRGTAAGYRCELAFVPRPSKDIGRMARVEGRALVLNGLPGEQIGCDLEGWSDAVADQGFTVSCAGTPARVQVSGDAPLSRLFVFFHPDYLAVEPFVRIAVAPGATVAWTRTYAFSAD